MKMLRPCRGVALGEDDPFAVPRPDGSSVAELAGGVGGEVRDLLVMTSMMSIS